MVLVLLHTVCTMFLHVASAVQAKGSAQNELGGVGAQAQGSATVLNNAKRTSQAFLETGSTRSPQDAMCQPPMPGLLVDHGVAVCPGLRIVFGCDGFPPSRARLHKIKHAASTTISS